MLRACKLDVWKFSGTAVSLAILWSADDTDGVFNERTWDLISGCWFANDKGLTAGRSVLHYCIPAWGSYHYIERINAEEYCVELWVVDSLDQEFDFVGTNSQVISGLKCKHELISFVIPERTFFYNLLYVNPENPSKFKPA